MEMNALQTLLNPASPMLKRGCQRRSVFAVLDNADENKVIAVPIFRNHPIIAIRH